MKLLPLLWTILLIASAAGPAAAAGDCNGNGVDDSAELSADGWGLDDGTAEGNYYVFMSPVMLAVQLDAGAGTTIKGIAVATTDTGSSVTLGHTMHIYIWDDPDDDGLPDDAVILSETIAHIDVFAAKNEPAQFNHWTFDKPVAVDGSFFIGVAYKEPDDDSYFNAIVMSDTTVPLNETRVWLAFDLPADNIRDAMPYANDKVRPLIRALSSDCNANQVPDRCELESGDLIDINGDGIPDTCACFADVAADGLVNEADLAVLLSEWSACPDGVCTADFNSDAMVDVFDLLLLLRSWGACR